MRIMATDIADNCMRHVLECVRGGLSIQHAYILVGSAVTSAAAGAVRAMATELGVPYTYEDHEAYLQKLQPIMREECDRVMRLYTGEQN